MRYLSVVIQYVNMHTVNVTAQGTGRCIHIPWSSDVTPSCFSVTATFLLSEVFVRHKSGCTESRKGLKGLQLIISAILQTNWWVSLLVFLLIWYSGKTRAGRMKWKRLAVYSVRDKMKYRYQWFQMIPFHSILSLGRVVDLVSWLKVISSPSLSIPLSVTTVHFEHFFLYFL